MSNQKGITISIGRGDKKQVVTKPGPTIKIQGQEVGYHTGQCLLSSGKLRYGTIKRLSRSHP